MTLRFALVLCAGLCACGADTPADDSGPEGPTHDFSFSGTGYDPHVGQTWEAAVVDATGAVRAAETGTFADATLSVTFPGALLEGEAHAFHLYVDFDSSGACSAADHMWAWEVPTVTGDVALEESHSMGFTNVCDTFAD